MQCTKKMWRCCVLEVRGGFDCQPCPRCIRGWRCQLPHLHPTLFHPLTSSPHTPFTYIPTLFHPLIPSLPSRESLHLPYTSSTNYIPFTLTPFLLHTFNPHHLTLSPPHPHPSPSPQVHCLSLPPLEIINHRSAVATKELYKPTLALKPLEV